VKPIKIERRRLGEQIFEVLSDEIIRGKHPAGKHLSEIEICSAMQVSRTPVREALFKLEQDGLVISRPNQGFYVASQSKQKVEESYTILAAMEALAVRTSAPFESNDIRRLEALNRRIQGDQGSRSSQFAADRDFHRQLIGKCPNASLLKLIETLKSEIERWDGGKRRGMAEPEKAGREHEQIIEYLRAGNSEGAAKVLEEHWQQGIQTVSSWIDEQGRQPEIGENGQTA
jgi:DNA-binding GntR family transcriptional regulator